MLIGIMGIGFEDRTRAGAVQHDRNAARGIMSCVGVERHAAHGHIHAEESFCMVPNRSSDAFGARLRDERRRQQQEQWLRYN